MLAFFTRLAVNQYYNLVVFCILINDKEAPLQHTTAEKLQSYLQPRLFIDERNVVLRYGNEFALKLSFNHQTNRRDWGLEHACFLEFGLSFVNYSEQMRQLRYYIRLVYTPKLHGIINI